MASNQTKHLKLCQWEADDNVLRADFNADNAKIDAAVAGVEQELNTSVTAMEKKIQTAQTQAATSVKAVEDKVTAEIARAKAAEANLTAKAEDSAAYIGNCIVVAGTYIGTGGYDSDHPCTLSFPYKPMLVLLEKDYLLRRGVGRTDVPFGSEVRYLVVSWSTNSVSWFTYSGGADYQCNVSGRTYHYVAFLAREEDTSAKGGFSAM